MYAVIMTGGKQYRVKEGDTLKIEKLVAEAGGTIDFDKVLMVGSGGDVTIGSPYVDGGKVSATVTQHGKRKKIKVVKFKRRKNYLRQKGHRQFYTEVQIIKIVGGNIAADSEA